MIMGKRLIYPLVIMLLSTAAEGTAVDPSSVPACDVTGNNGYVERWRILTDLDGDGMQDMILSGDPAMFGNAGGPWDVYLNRNGEFRCVGRIGAHPLAISIEPDQDRHEADFNKRRYARIWTYWHLSSASGALGYFRVGEETVDECRSVLIYAGDAGTTLGNALYEAAFKNSAIPFTLQYSSTDNEGNMVWGPPPNRLSGR